MSVPTPQQQVIKKNGQPPQQEKTAALVEQGLNHFHTVVAERDHLKELLSRVDLEMRALKTEISDLTSQLNSERSRISTYQIERDQAVAERAVYETLFISIQAQMRTFAVPAAPLVRAVNTENNEAEYGTAKIEGYGGHGADAEMLKKIEGYGT